MNEEKEFNGVVNTENFTDEDYDNFLDYLEDIKDLDEEKDEEIIDINDDLDDDSNEVEVYNLVSVRNQEEKKQSGVNFEMKNKNGSKINISNDGINLNISLDSIVSGINSLSQSIKEAKYNNIKRQNKLLKKKLKKKK